MNQSTNDERNRLVGDLYIKYERELINFAKGLLKDTYKAEDIVHLTFVTVLENISRLDLSNDKSVRGLLYTIVKHFCFNNKRDNKKYVFMEAEFMSFERSVPDSGYDQVAYNELLDVMNDLRLEYKEILYYKGVCGLRSVDIAQYLNISPALARKRLSRARKAMIKKLSQLNMI